MSHECPMCGQWVNIENDLTPEQDAEIRKYVDFLADKKLKEQASIPRAQIEALIHEMQADGDYCNDEPWRQKMYREFCKRLSALLHPELKGEGNNG